MHRSSDTIGNISGALARAQAELHQSREVAGCHHPVAPSPVKPTAASAMRRCRAAWTLSARALAGMRSRPLSRRTSIRKAASFASRPFLRIPPGNGVSSEWPVCPISDVASAQRMGAALTLRPALCAAFTLVGIPAVHFDAPLISARLDSPQRDPPRAPRQSQAVEQAAAQRTGDGDMEMSEAFSKVRPGRAAIRQASGKAGIQHDRRL